ncbi:phosphatase PAP2 family protein [Candidatus Woesearchaeota archaeon]|nr:phosphatase PAP2 family protein [Candidatus Woesearchaeota archaeon]
MSLSLALNSLVGKYALLDASTIFLAQYLLYAFALFLPAFGRNKKAWIQVASTFLLSLAVSKSISFLYYVPRPFLNPSFNQLIPHISDGSFPSDHATMAFAVAIPLYFQYKQLGILALILASLISVARVITGIHYFSDVVGGFAIALVIAIGMKKCLEVKAVEKMFHLHPYGKE